MRNHSGRKQRQNNNDTAMQTTDEDVHQDYQDSDEGGYESKSSQFIKAVERQLAEHPQIGAMILDGVVMACGRVTEFIEKFEEQLKQKVETLRGSISDGSEGNASSSDEDSSSSRKTNKQSTRNTSSQAQ